MIDVSNGDRFYMASDGFTDQVGGEKRRMYGKKRFTQLMTSLHRDPFVLQKDRFMGSLAAYQGEEMRRDDVCMIGFTLA